MTFDLVDFISDLRQLLQARRYQEALLFCEKSLKHSKDEAVLVEYVRLLLCQKYYEKAFETLKKYTASPYQSLNVLELYSEYYSHTGNLSELNLLRENMAKQEPTNSVKVNTCLSLCGLGIDRLIQQFSEEIKYWSKKQNRHSTLLKKIYNLLKQGLIEECNETLLKVITDYPNTLLSRYLEAEVLLLSGKLDRAEAAFDGILAEYPKPAVIHDRLGDISSRQANYKKAVRHYQYSLNYDSSSVQTWMELVECYVKLGKHSQAKACVNKLKQSGKLDSNDVFVFENCLNHDFGGHTIKKVFGLVVTEGGGNLLPIEFARTDSPGCLVSGNVSMVLYDSVQVAFHCVKNQVLGKLALDHGILVNIPQNICFKDGPSAGMAFAVGIMAVMKDMDVPSRAAFTGEIGLNGEIYPVGGIVNKILAAWYSNVRYVLLPASNHPEMAKLPNEIKQQMKLVFAQSLNSVVNDIWN